MTLAGPSLTADYRPIQRGFPPRGISTGLIIVLALIASSAALGASLYYVHTYEVEEVPLRVSDGASTTWYFSGDYDPNCTFVMEVHGCSGEPGTVEVWTPVRHIEDFLYQGQADVYLGSIHRVYYDSGTVVNESWEWFGGVTADFRAGLWVPSDGIEFRHSVNQTFGDARLIGLTSPTVIPEFSGLLVPMLAVLVTILAYNKISLKMTRRGKER